MFALVIYDLDKYDQVLPLSMSLHEPHVPAIYIQMVAKAVVKIKDGEAHLRDFSVWIGALSNTFAPNLGV